MPLDSSTPLVTRAAPSDVFFVLARVLRSAPKACALITATVHDMGAGPGEGDPEWEEMVWRRGSGRVPLKG